jgi:DNA-directed RNA polymerase specialized sigma24 family protein
MPDHRMLTDEGKAQAVRRFLAGQTPAEVGLTLNVSARTIEEALREAIRGLSQRLVETEGVARAHGR